MKGVRADRYGLRAYVSVGTGAHRQQREKRYPFDTDAATIKAWRDETRAGLRKLRRREPGPGTLHVDLARYLAQVAAMPTCAERERHLRLWEGELGAETERHAITRAMIDTILHRWRAAGLAPATCNKRRSALMHLWSTLDGRSAANPVRETTKFRVADALPRGRDPHVLDAKLLKAPHCRSRACCRVLLWTGMRPIELQRAEPDDLNRRRRMVIVRTAKGGRVRVLPLTVQAVEAWQEFDAEDCWHRVPRLAPLNRWLKTHTGIASLRVYDLRHSFGTALARCQTRLDVIGALMGHSTLELTKRYTLAAVLPDALQATRNLAQKSGRRRNPRKSA